MYKMVDVTKEVLENNGIEVIIDSVNALWLNERHTEEQLGYKKVTSSYKQI